MLLSWLKKAQCLVTVCQKPKQVIKSTVFICSFVLERDIPPANMVYWIFHDYLSQKFYTHPQQNLQSHLASEAHILHLPSGCQSIPSSSPAHWAFPCNEECLEEMYEGQLLRLGQFSMLTSSQSSALTSLDHKVNSRVKWKFSFLTLS